MASAGGEDLIGWHVNRGWTQDADFFPESPPAPSTTGQTSPAGARRLGDEAEAIGQANATATEGGVRLRSRSQPHCHRS